MKDLNVWCSVGRGAGRYRLDATRPALVNGAAGAVLAPKERLFSVMAFTVTNGRITQIDALLDPERLTRLDLSLR